MRVSGLDILVLAHYTSSAERSNNRFNEISDLLAQRGHRVEMVTSGFDHRGKTRKEPGLDDDLPYTVTYVEEPGYRRNISVSRVLSHRAFAANVKRYLAERPGPDVVYCAFPSDAVAKVGYDYARQVGAEFVLDVQDLWPEAFELLVRPRPLARLAFLPMRRKVEAIYRGADHVVTVSETYSERVRRVRDNPASVTTTYLGTNLGRVDQYPPRMDGLSPDRINLAYIGMLGVSYDLPLIFEAIRRLDENDPPVPLHLMGAGPLEQEWREMSADLGESVKFHGVLDYPEMFSRLRACDIAVNPIVPGAAQSITNKVCDYAAAGRPVISTQESPEYQDLLRRFDAGISCAPDASIVAGAIRDLAGDERRRAQLAAGSREMAEQLFNRAETYRELADLIDALR